jgi:primosomal protein N' (replication factor Y)
VPRLGLLTYRAPRDLALVPGARVRVPLGSRVVTGWVVDPEAPLPAGAIDFKRIASVIDPEPFFPHEVMRLALWTAEYYLCGPGETLAAAAPPLSKTRESAFKQQRVARIGRAAVEDERLTDKQRDALAKLSEAAEGIAVAALQKEGLSNAVLTGLAKRGLVVIEDEIVHRDPFSDEETALEKQSGAKVSPLAIEPTEDQRLVLTELEALAARRTFDVALLHGVTGSGKTQVYLRLADAVRRLGRRVLMLVPEISLTPAMASVFRRAFGDRVAIQHSGLSDGERHDQWHRIRQGAVDIVVGTRSAVWAPLPDVGLIVVDEEHDSSYKQEESPRYHGRDVALVRAKQAHALVLLGSATPSLETYQHALSGRYRHLRLDRRVLDRPLADVRTINMRDEYADLGPDVILSRALCEGLQVRLDAGEQSLILLNRRGYAHAIFCRQCAETLECPNCSVTLTIHRTARRARCHYCDYELRVPERCTKCGGEFLDYRGYGTERIEAEVRALMPQARLARVDRDTVRRRGAIARVLQRFARRELDVLIGTQMIAKGHDFPEVTLVGVVSADIGLGVADFRASERTFQLLTQVVGRAGRGTRRGEAIIQTLYPDHYSIEHAGRQDYRAFFAKEIEYRRGMHWPPALSLVSIVVRGASLEQAMRDAQTLVRAFGPASAAQAGHQGGHQAGHQAGPGGANGRGRLPFEVKGPGKAPLERLRGEYRAQFFLRGTARAAMRQAMAAALARHPDIARRTSVDVDPLSML